MNCNLTAGKAGLPVADDSSALAALNGLRYGCNRPPESARVRLRANRGLSVGCISARVEGFNSTKGRDNK